MAKYRLFLYEREAGSEKLKRTVKRDVETADLPSAVAWVFQSLSRSQPGTLNRVVQLRIDVREAPKPQLVHGNRVAAG